MGNKTKNLVRHDITWETEGVFFHLIKLAVQSNGEVFVHFISRNKEDIWTDGELKKIPDHISYHKDGRIHIKHKGGERSILPFRFQTSLLDIPGFINAPFLAVSYYKNRFEMYKQHLTKLDKKPINHLIIPSENSFTVVFYLRDLTKTPFEKRSIDIEYISGCLPIKEISLPKLEDGAKASPVFNALFNPTAEELSQLDISDIIVKPKESNEKP